MTNSSDIPNVPTHYWDVVKQRRVVVNPARKGRMFYSPELDMCIVSDLYGNVIDRCHANGKDMDALMERHNILVGDNPPGVLVTEQGILFDKPER